jgi:hypothetical protein
VALAALIFHIAAQRAVTLKDLGENEENSAPKSLKSLKVNQRSVICIQERGAVMLMH